MKPSTLQVLQREARLRSNHARLQLQAAQGALEEKERDVARLVEARLVLVARMASKTRARKENAGEAVRRAAWQATLRRELAALDERQRDLRRIVTEHAATVEQLRNEVTDALRRKQATESMARAMRDAEHRQRERRAQGLLDEVAAWRSVQRTARGSSGEPG